MTEHESGTVRDFVCGTAGWCMSDLRQYYIFGYERREDGLPGDRAVAQRGLAISTDGEAQRVRADAERDRPDLIWEVEWRRVRVTG